MGKEADCRATIDGVAVKGRALLETDEILIRRPDGERRLKVLLKDIRDVKVERGALVLRHTKGTLSLELGPSQAAAWAKRILEPPGLLDKLGVKEGSIVVTVGLNDEEFAHSLELRGATVIQGRKGKDADMVLFGAESTADLKKLAGLDGLIHPAGGIWIIYPKGQAHIREADIMEAGRGAGWSDNKTCRFSDTHTGLRFVIPVEKRAAAKR